MYPSKMQMYTEKGVLRWIDAELDYDAHNKLLVLGDAEVEGWVKAHDELLQKKKKVPPEDEPPSSKKRNHQHLKVFSLLSIHLFYIQ